MLEYRITLARSAENEIATLPLAVQKRVANAIDKLASNPHPPGGKKLRGSHHIYRVRVGDYRIIYEIYARERMVDVTHVRHRREAYD